MHGNGPYLRQSARRRPGSCWGSRSADGSCLAPTSSACCRHCFTFDSASRWVRTVRADRHPACPGSIPVAGPRGLRRVRVRRTARVGPCRRTRGSTSYRRSPLTPTADGRAGHTRFAAGWCASSDRRPERPFLGMYVTSSAGSAENPVANHRRPSKASGTFLGVRPEDGLWLGGWVVGSAAVCRGAGRGLCGGVGVGDLVVAAVGDGCRADTGGEVGEGGG